MKQNKNPLGARTVLAALFLILAIGFAYGAIEENLVYLNNSVADSLNYDRFNSSAGEGAYYGSNSYMDDTPTNQDVFLYLCHPNLTAGQLVDIAYYTESRNTTDSILNYRPRVTYTNVYSDSGGTYYCGRINIDISGANALYPGRVLPIIYDSAPDNTTNLTRSHMLSPLSPQNLTGRYEVGINVIAPPKTFFITPQRAYDSTGEDITRTEPHLLLSLVNSQNTSILEGQISLGGAVEYGGNFHGGEKVYVNGLKSLEIRPYRPCGQINESGYYIMNESIFNVSETCIVINSTNSVILNFGTELVDGDDSDVGSMRDEICAITVLNSRNITLENVIAQQFHKGICVTNSTLYLLGLGVVYNRIGAFITDDSNVVIIDTHFINNDSEISSFNNSVVTMITSNISTASLKTVFRDTILRSVNNPPAPPDNLTDIGQWAWYEKSSPNAYASINFYYTIPLPNNVSTENLSIYKYKGIYGPLNQTGNGTGGENSSQMGWSNGVWTKVFTLISPSELLIIGPNTTDYSIFAPFAQKSNTSNNPEPEPEPQPEPAGGGTSGGAAGAGPSTPGPSVVQTYPGMIELELVLPPNVSIMQGEAGRIDFNLTDKSPAAAYNITIDSVVPRGWETTNRSIPIILPNQTLTDYFLMAPFEKAVPGTYYIPVRASTVFLNRTFVFTEKLLQVIVLPRGDLQRIKIIEYSPSVEIGPGATLNLSFVAQNIGDMDLSNITVRYNPNDCLDWVRGSNDIDLGEAKVISYLIHSGKIGRCDVDFEFYSGEKMVGFAPLTFIVRPRGLLSPIAKRILLVIVLLGWTVLTAIVLNRRRRLQER